MFKKNKIIVKLTCYIYNTNLQYLHLKSLLTL